MTSPPIGTDEELIERLRDWCNDWDGSPMPDAATTRVELTCETVRETIDALQSRISDVERLTEALELFTGQAVFDPHTHRVSVDEFVVSKARAAISQHRATDELSE